MKPRHIALTCATLHDHAGRQAVALASHLAQHGHKVSLVCHLPDRPKGLDPRVEVHGPSSLPSLMSLRLLKAHRYTIKALNALTPDVRVSMLTTVPGDVVVVCNGTVARLQRAHVQAQPTLPRRAARMGLMLLPSRLFARWLEKRALSAPTLKTLVALSPRLVARLASDEQRDGVEVIGASPMPVDETIEPGEGAAVRRRLARGLSIDEAARWLVMPFDSAELGGVEAMIRAFKPLVDGGVDAVLLLAGPSRYTHLAWIAQLGLRSRVRFVGQTDRMAELMAASDLVVQPTAYDPGGWGVMPALGSGVPVITTAASDLADQVRRRGGVVLESPADPAQLLEALREQLDDGPDPGLSPENAGSGPAAEPSPPLGQVVAELIDAREPG